MMGWPRGSARHDGRLPLQVLGDVGVVDVVMQSYLFVQDDAVGQVYDCQGGWGQLVVAD